MSRQDAEIHLGRTRGYLATESFGDDVLRSCWITDRVFSKKPVVFVNRCGDEADVIWLPQSFSAVTDGERARLQLHTRVMKRSQHLVVIHGGEAITDTTHTWCSVSLPIRAAHAFARWIVEDASTLRFQGPVGSIAKQEVA